MASPRGGDDSRVTDSTLRHGRQGPCSVVLHDVLRCSCTLCASQTTSILGHGRQGPCSVLLHDILRCSCPSCKSQIHLTTPGKTQRVTARGLVPSTAGVRGGTPRGLLRNRRVDNDAQGNVPILPPLRMGSTSPIQTARDDPDGDLGHGVTVVLPSDGISCVLCGQFVGMCRGLEAPPCGGSIATAPCKECGRGFASARALSTHERHVHPVLRNTKRIQMARMQRASTRWTEQEVALLKQLVMEFAGNLNSPNDRLVPQQKPRGGQDKSAVRENVRVMCMPTLYVNG
ncbi:hypothetical protein SRHO_G00340750 [Serrasalmus rhombeus]